ncbi:hypothetical protein [Streptomyces sp. enrichment culture]|uniref:hypothetical protein n=1 Tax=Streptomyces sp. enrichment culture TaxID=1795815 RepID=UPI003F55BF4E
MAVPPHEFRQAKAQFFDLEPLATDQDAWVTSVAVTVRGILGSANTSVRSRPQDYRLLIDVSRLREELPAVWVYSPPNSQIQHVNIFRPREICPFTRSRLPLLCWGSTGSAWQSEPQANRSLSNFLEAARQVLANANMNSRAR